MPERPDFFVSGANKSLQENLVRGEPVIFASYGVVGAILLLGGAGYLVDRSFGTLPWFLLAGLSVGLCVAFYVLVKTVRRR
jgi:F0F1-type ATP synthase assembly protein I